MKRLALGLLLVCAGLAIFAADLQAAETVQRSQKRERIEYPPRYTRDTMAQWYVYKNRQGQVKTRKTYPGYAEHFPPPAYLFYGYPKSGDFSGMGMNGSP